MLNVVIDTSPLHNFNAIRGVGLYTRMLMAELEKFADVKVIKKIQPGRQSKNNEPKPDLIHYPYFDLFFPTLPLFRKSKTVVTVHDVIPLIYPEFYRPGKRGGFHLYRQRFALQHVDAVLTDSESSKKDIIQYLKVSPNKVHVIYLAGNPALHKMPEEKVEKVRKKYKLPTQYILYVGDINYNKNLPQLMKALKFLPDVHLVCVGKNFFPHNIPEWHAIETQIAASDVPTQVHFITDIGADDSDELAAIYSGAALYIQPSLYEGFGLPVLEAMQCEVPVVSTKTSSLIEVGGEHVEFTATDAEAMVAGIKNVLALAPTERARRVTAALAWSQHFSWEKAAKATLQVYETVARTNSKPNSKDQ